MVRNWGKISALVFRNCGKIAVKKSIGFGFVIASKKPSLKYSCTLFSRAVASLNEFISIVFEFFINLIPKYIKYIAPTIFTIKKIVAEVVIIAPKPKIDMVDRILNPSILPKEEATTFFISPLRPFTMAKNTAGPGLIIIKKETVK